MDLIAKLISQTPKYLKKNGKLIFSYVNYYNPRGLVLLALMLLVNAKITLSDKYFFAPDELKKNLIKCGFKKISFKSSYFIQWYYAGNFMDICPIHNGVKYIYDFFIYIWLLLWDI